VHFTSSDAQAVLPANYTFTSTDAGKHTFANGVTLKTAGTQSITATDTVNSSLTGTQSPITVNPASASHIMVTAPSNVTHGVAFNITVTMLDAFGNVATGYLGTVKFTSSDGAAMLPPNYPFTAADAGIHTFSVILNTIGTQSITVTDTIFSSITGTASGIQVSAATVDAIFQEWQAAEEEVDPTGELPALPAALADRVALLNAADSLTTIAKSISEVGKEGTPADRTTAARAAMAAVVGAGWRFQRRKRSESRRRADAADRDN
jgi:hypothetical protein